MEIIVAIAVFSVSLGLLGLGTWVTGRQLRPGCGSGVSECACGVEGCAGGSRR